MNISLLLNLIKVTISIFIGLFVSLGIVVKLINLNPKDQESVEPICTKNSVPLFKGGELKVLSWNVQYFASKNYTFFYDIIDESGPDTMPSKTDVDQTFNEVVRVIKAENPDIIFLQEVDEGARRTYFENQTERLINLLNQANLTYPCLAETFYWKSVFVPHPKIMGPVGLKLVILSKYQIKNGLRDQLPVMPKNYFVRSFNFKRAILSVDLPLEHEQLKSIKLLTTHLDAFAQGTDTMEKQVQTLFTQLKELEKNGTPYILGGDFNLLPNEEAYNRLPPNQKLYFKTPTELAPFFKNFLSIPASSDMVGESANDWLTHFPNDPSVKAPDRTIDYIFYPNNSRIVLKEKKVRKDDTLKISDHLPVIATFFIE